MNVAGSWSGIRAERDSRFHRSAWGGLFLALFLFGFGLEVAAGQTGLLRDLPFARPVTMAADEDGVVRLAFQPPNSGFWSPPRMEFFDGSSGGPQWRSGSLPIHGTQVHRMEMVLDRWGRSHTAVLTTQPLQLRVLTTEGPFASAASWHAWPLTDLLVTENTRFALALREVDDVVSPVLVVTDPQHGVQVVRWDNLVPQISVVLTGPFPHPDDHPVVAPSVAFDAWGRLHVAYARWSAPAAGQLHYATEAGQGWMEEVVLPLPVSNLVMRANGAERFFSLALEDGRVPFLLVHQPSAVHPDSGALVGPVQVLQTNELLRRAGFGWQVRGDFGAGTVENVSLSAGPDGFLAGAFFLRNRLEWFAWRNGTGEPLPIRNVEPGWKDVRLRVAGEHVFVLLSREGGPSPRSFLYQVTAGNLPIGIDANGAYSLPGLVRKNLGRSPLAPVTSEDWAQLQVLQSDISGGRISDLGLLRRAVGLERLLLPHHRVTDVEPLLDLPGLVEVNLVGNGLDERMGSKASQDLAVLSQMPGRQIQTHAQRSPWNWLLEPKLRQIVRMAVYGSPFPQPPLAPWFHPHDHNSPQWIYSPGVVTQGRVTSLRGLELAWNLEGISLLDHRVSDLTPLAGLRRLNWIELEGNEVTDLGPLLEWSAAPPEGFVSQLVNLESNGLDLQSGTPSAQGKALLISRGVAVSMEEFSQRNPWNFRLLDPLLERELRRRLPSFPDEQFPPLSSFGGFGLTSLEDMDPHVVSLWGIGILRELFSLDISHTKVRDLLPLRDLPQLRQLFARREGSAVGPGIRSLEALRGLRNLHHLDLTHQQITDLSPIVASLQPGGTVIVDGNGLDLRSGSKARQDAARLQAREVAVLWGGQVSAWNWLLDDAVAGRVRQALGLSPTDHFQISHEEALSGLDLSDLAVLSLHGLERAPNLHTLVASPALLRSFSGLPGAEGSWVWQSASARQADLSQAESTGLTGGREEVVQNPGSFGLFRREDIMDLRFEGVILEPAEGRFRVRWQVEGSEDLRVWEEVDSFTSEMDFPEKYFLRLRAGAAEEDGN
jgi:Leucine-rich repeat (LRR) protein